MEFRRSIESDLAGLVALLADDKLGVQREDASLSLNAAYLSAFAAIDSDPNNELVVVEDKGELLGMLQLTFIPYLTHKGSWRCLIEGVRIHSRYRGQGLGRQFFRWAIQRARERNCKLVQLTSDKQRPDALRFYESLGFQATHEGYKLPLA